MYWKCVHIHMYMWRGQRWLVDVDNFSRKLRAQDICISIFWSIYITNINVNIYTVNEYIYIVIYMVNIYIYTYIILSYIHMLIALRCIHMVLPRRWRSVRTDVPTAQIRTYTICFRMHPYASICTPTPYLRFRTPIFKTGFRRKSKRELKNNGLDFSIMCSKAQNRFESNPLYQM